YTGGATLLLAAALAVGAAAAALGLLNPELTELSRLYGRAGFAVPMLTPPILAGFLVGALLCGLVLGSLGVRRQLGSKP
ncbi:MAG: hypothetical protein ACOY5V_13790, partial [Pseudomonadota bacterium]